MAWGGAIDRVELELNARGPLLKSCLGPLARYGTHQETMRTRLEQAYLPSDSRLDLPGEGHYESWILINDGGGGKIWALLKSPPGLLFTSGVGPWPDMALV